MHRSNCFRRSEKGRHYFERGDKPEQFATTIPNQRAWSAFLRSSTAQNAIHVARRFEDELERIGGKSYATVAERFGVSRPMVSYHIALVRRLPDDFVVWLETQQDPAILAYFTERRLRPVTRLDNVDEQVALLTAMIAEVVPPDSEKR